MPTEPNAFQSMVMEEISVVFDMMVDGLERLDVPLLQTLLQYLERLEQVYCASPTVRDYQQESKDEIKDTLSALGRYI